VAYPKTQKQNNQNTVGEAGSIVVYTLWASEIVQGSIPCHLNPPMSLLDKAKKNAENRSQNHEEKPEMYQTFLQEKIALALEAIYDEEETITPSEVKEITDTTYAHAVKQVQRLEGFGLVRSKKKGRKKFLFITDTGEMVAEKLVELDEALTKASEV